MAEMVAYAAVSAATGLATRALTSESRSEVPVQQIEAPARVVYDTERVDLTIDTEDAPRESPLSVKPDQDGPQIGIMGHRRIGGRIVLAAKSSVDNKYYVVIVFAGAPVAEISAIHMNNVTIARDASDFVITPPWNNSSTKIKVYDGTQAAADSVLMTAFPGWTADFIGEKCAYARIQITTSASPTGYANGLPDFTFTVKGFACYDPRNPGHDIDDSSTWGDTENAAIINANYLIHELGAALPVSLVDWGSVATAANTCDESVATLDGTEPRYRAALQWTTDERHETVLARIGTAHAGGAFLVGDRYRICTGAYTAPSASIGVDDYAGNGFTWSDYTPIASTCNGVRGVFASPLHNYELKDFPPYVNSSARTEDGGLPYWLDLTLEAVTSPSQAQRLAKLAFNRARNAVGAEVELKFSHFDTVADDVVTITEPLAGFEDKPFRVVREALEADFVVRLTLAAEDPAFYAFTPSTDEQAFTAAPSIFGASPGYGSSAGDAGPLTAGGGELVDGSGTAGTVSPRVNVWASPRTPAPSYRGRINYTATVKTWEVVVGVGTAPGFPKGSWQLNSVVATTYTQDVITTGSLLNWGLSFTDQADKPSGSYSIPSGIPYYGTTETTTTYVINSVQVSTEASGETAAWATLESGSLGLSSFDGLSSGGSPYFALATPCTPYVNSGSGTSYVLKTNNVPGARATHVELWAFSGPDVTSSSSMIARTANGGSGTTFAVSGTAGTGFYYRCRSYNSSTGRVSPWSNSFLLVFQ